MAERGCGKRRPPTNLSLYLMKTEVETLPAATTNADVAQEGMAAVTTSLPAAVAAAATVRRTPAAASLARRRPPARASRWLAGAARALAVPVAALLLWQLISDPRVREWPVLKALPGLSAKLPSAQILPPPSKVFTKLIEYAQPTDTFPAWQEKLTETEKAGAWKSSHLRWALSGELPSDTLASLLRVVIGFAIGAGLALPLGLMMGASKTVYGLFNPLMQMLRPIPPIAYIPLAILWFGLGNPPAYFLISLGAFFPVLVNTISGVRNVDGIFLRAAQNLGARGFTMFWRVILPAATPYILTGVRVGIGVAFICVIVAELIAVNSGLGYRIMEAREFFWSDKIIAGMISIGLLGLALDTLMDWLNNHLLRWHRGADAAGGH